MKLNGTKIFSTLVILVVITIAIGGAYLAGSPAKVREAQLDSRRVSDLQSISYAVENYWRVQKKLPVSLEELKKTRDVYVNTITDPESFAPYEYRSTGAMTYALCATFALPSESPDPKVMYTTPQPYGYQGTDFWNHPAGHFCYAVEVHPDPNSIPVK